MVATGEKHNFKVPFARTTLRRTNKYVYRVYGTHWTLKENAKIVIFKKCLKMGYYTIQSRELTKNIHKGKLETKMGWGGGGVENVEM